MGEIVCYWEYYVEDDHRRRFVSSTFTTKLNLMAAIKSKMQHVSEAYHKKVILKLFEGSEVRTTRLSDVNFN